MEVIKRDNKLVPFDSSKIYSAIMKAMKNGSGIVKPTIAKTIAEEIEQDLKNQGKQKIQITDIETMVFNKLIAKKQKPTAKAYESYRAIQEFKRSYTDLDKKIEGIVDGSNKDTLEENSNKNAYVASTQRDLIAGEYSKDYSRRKVLPANILHAHDEGMLHIHDLDYFLQLIHNCCLINLEDMLQNGTVINKTMIESPKSFQTACTITTQIIQQVSNGQYGGQTFNLAHLSPFVRLSYERFVKKYHDRGCSLEEIEVYALEDLKREVEAGIQTIQYQLITFNTSNGQSPFLSIFMYLNDNPEYIKETAMLIEEILKQRILGVKNEVGAYITPTFPKLLYVTDENNIYPDSEYYYLTLLAAECVSKRMMPDFISAKIMKQDYDGEVFGCMGCRAWLAPYIDPNTGKYKWWGRFNSGVVTLNLVDVGLSADKDMDAFWNILDERLDLCYQALIMRHERLRGTSTDISPIHWKHGALARLQSNNFDELLFNGYSTLSLGYAGLYECVMSLIGESHTTEKGQKLALDIMHYLRNTTDRWKKETNIGFALYGTPLESTTYKLARCLKSRFGIIEGITDHDYVTNSYHVNVQEEISAEDKLIFESQFHSISSGGCISYIETANLSQNIDVIVQMIQFMYHHIRYAEMNGKFDYCHECGYEGEILIDDNNEWYCPNCGNRNHKTMNVVRRTCGYLGSNFWNYGRTAEIKDRYVHLDNKELVIEEE